MKHSHIFISLGSDSWGRALLARSIASDLTRMGDEVCFLTHPALASIFSNSAFQVATVPDHMGSLMGVYLDHLAAERHPTTVILADLFSNANYLHSMGIGPAKLLLQDAAMFTLDIWDSEQTGYDIDMFEASRAQLGPGSSENSNQGWEQLFERIPNRLKPVPIVRPRRLKGHFCALPESGLCMSSARLGRRKEFGLAAREKLVLFCTNSWQHREYKCSTGARRLASALPELIAEYLSHLGSSVRLIHVGPQPYDLSLLKGRYHWVPPLEPHEFDTLLGAADLLVSANISATSIAKALTLNVPVMVLQNSISAANREEAESMIGGSLSSWLARWLDSVLPIFPFALWPLGFHRFLQPLLLDNPYVAAVSSVEILQQEQVESLLSMLLFDPVRRENHLRQQRAYLDQVRTLPTGAESIKAALEA